MNYTRKLPGYNRGFVYIRNFTEEEGDNGQEEKKKSWSGGLMLIIHLPLYVAASIFFQYPLCYRNKGEWIFLCIPVVFLSDRKLDYRQMFKSYKITD